MRLHEPLWTDRFWLLGRMVSMYLYYLCMILVVRASNTHFHLRVLVIVHEIIKCQRRES
jgi:hypothetical protein